MEKKETKTKKPNITEQKEKMPMISFIVLFKIEGHETYRVGFYKTKEDFDIYLRDVNHGKHPTVTERIWFSVNRSIGSITEE